MLLWFLCYGWLDLWFGDVYMLRGLCLLVVPWIGGLRCFDLLCLHVVFGCCFGDLRCCFVVLLFGCFDLFLVFRVFAFVGFD